MAAMKAAVSAFKLRDYQAEDRKAVSDAFLNKGVTRALGVWPTGGGKTVMFSELHLEPAMQDWLSQFPVSQQKILVIAHRDELIDQAAKKLAASNPNLIIEIEKAEKKASPLADVVVASIQTLTSAKGKRLHRFNPDQFRIVVVDEAHHAASPSYLVVLQHFGFLPPAHFMQEAMPERSAGKNALLEWQRDKLAAWDLVHTPDRLLLGVTATPKRGDNIGLEAIFQHIVFNRSIRELMEQGYLCRLRAFRVLTDTSLDEVATRAGDFAQDALGTAVNSDKRNAKAVKAYLQYAPGKKGVTFCVTVAHAQSLAAAYNTAGVPAAAIHGMLSDEKRKEMLDKFRNGELQMLTNCQILTEGTDIPDIECIIHARPTKSTLLYCLDTATEVLTPEGWKWHDQVSVGSTIAAFDTFSGRIVWQDATNYVVRPLDPTEYMIGIDSPTVSMRVSNRHRVVHRNLTGYDISAAEDLQSYEGFSIPVSGVQSVTGIDLTPSEIAFCGLVQTDGCFNHANGAITISQSTAAKEACAHIEAVLTACGFKWRFSDNNEPTNLGPRTAPQRTYRISMGKPRGQDKHLRGWGALQNWIWKAGGSWTNWEQISVAQFRVLVDSLWWGDGNKEEPIDYKHRTVAIACADKPWADRFQSLAVRRGWRCNLYEHNFNPQPIYMIRLRELTQRHVPAQPYDDRPSFKAEKFRPETVWCIEVPTGAFMARRNGKVFVTGNCQMTGRGLRVHPGKTECVVIDIVDVTRKHSLISAPELLGLPMSFDAKGEDLLETKVRIEDAIKQNPLADLEDVKSLDDIRLRVQEVDLLGQFHDETIDAHAKLAWRKTGEGYELGWRGSNRLLNESMQITKSDNGWDISFKKDARSNKAHWQDTATTAADAIKKAETYVKETHDWVHQMMQKEKSWATAPATEHQKANLKNMGYNIKFDKLTRGEAKNLIQLYYSRQGV